jgi:hypothetical protein
MPTPTPPNGGPPAPFDNVIDAAVRLAQRRAEAEADLLNSSSEDRKCLTPPCA